MPATTAISRIAKQPPVRTATYRPCQRRGCRQTYQQNAIPAASVNATSHERARLTAGQTAGALDTGGAGPQQPDEQRGSEDDGDRATDRLPELAPAPVTVHRPARARRAHRFSTRPITIAAS